VGARCWLSCCKELIAITSEGSILTQHPPAKCHCCTCVGQCCSCHVTTAFILTSTVSAQRIITGLVLTHKIVICAPQELEDDPKKYSRIWLAILPWHCSTDKD
jgi:hypothetical protein